MSCLCPSAPVVRRRVVENVCASLCACIHVEPSLKRRFGAAELTPFRRGIDITELLFRITSCFMSSSCLPAGCWMHECLPGDARCQSRPADMSREEASVAAVCGSGDASVRAGRRGKEIRVELRVPSEEVGERWTALFRDRAALEVVHPPPCHLQELHSRVGT